MSFRVKISEEEQEIDETTNTINGDEHQLEPEGRWLSLTNDVLALILKRLNTKADICRFRSICKSWRLFATPPQNHILFPLSLPPLNPNTSPLSISPILFYLISPQITLSGPQEQRTWLAKVAEKADRKWDLLNPLTNHKLYFSSGVFRKRINLLGFRSYEVGRSYSLRYVRNSGDDDGETFDFDGFSSGISVKKLRVNLIEDKVSVLWLFNLGDIAIWNLGDEKWKFIKIKEKKENDIDDVICYDGRFFAVDRRGRLVVINQTTFELDEIVAPIEDSCKFYVNYYLVEASFRLYLVCKIDNPRPANYYDEEEEEWVADKTRLGKPLGFKVFVLNEKGKSWERVTSVGNKVLFLSRDASFSVSAEDLGWNMGNCVYFEGLTGYDDEADMRFGLNAGVYNLENDAISILDSLPGSWTEIFFPPSNWFLQDHEEYPEYEMQD